MLHYLVSEDSVGDYWKSRAKPKSLGVGLWCPVSLVWQKKHIGYHWGNSSVGNKEVFICCKKKWGTSSRIIACMCADPDRSLLGVGDTCSMPVHSTHTGTEGVSPLLHPLHVLSTMRQCEHLYFICASIFYHMLASLWSNPQELAAWMSAQGILPHVEVGAWSKSESQPSSVPLQFFLDLGMSKRMLCKSHWSLPRRHINTASSFITQSIFYLGQVLIALLGSHMDSLSKHLISSAMRYEHWQG